MADPLKELIASANEGEQPSPFGKMEIIVPGSPASVQSGKSIKEAYVRSIEEKCGNLEFLLTGDLILNITWLLPTKSRYETDAKADIDNCIKPIIDAFTGPKGLFIDDCQLQGLYICWRQITSSDERLIFELEFKPDDFIRKSDIAFVRLEKGLCTPVNLNWPRMVRVEWDSYLKRAEAAKDVLERLDVPYPLIAGFLGNSRPFHITRVRGFKVVTTEEFIS